MSIDRVVPGLYLGDIEGTKNLKTLKTFGITHIL